jgi:hypothetical protein
MTSRRLFDHEWMSGFAIIKGLGRRPKHEVADDVGAPSLGELDNHGRSQALGISPQLAVACDVLRDSRSTIR